jgi:predicted O-methyltransferase YrrM
MGISRPTNVRHRLRVAAAREALRRSESILNQTILALDYPPNAANVPRYSRPHPQLGELIAAGEDRYREILATIGAYTSDLERIAVRGGGETQPSWINGFLPGLDGAAIYSLLRSRAPGRYIEIGSGNSTKFAARAKRDGELSTKITSIDPFPRASIDALCDQVVRKPLESVDSSLWEEVRPDDVIFMDGSHRVFMNNDVVAFFLDVLPRLPAGTLVGVHDVYLPFDYPGDIADRYYSEQYVLAAYLLGGASVELVLAAYYASMRMQSDVEELWAKSTQFAGIEHHGVAFWLQTK